MATPRHDRAMTPLDHYDWIAIAGALNAEGWARLPRLFDADECADIVALDRDDAAFRKRIVMARHGYGRGEYGYFAYPLPPAVAHLRTELYARLAPIANDWAARMGNAVRYPDCHAEYLAACHAAGQTRPTPLLLRYRAGDYNRLHQDLYGAMLFPIQLVALLSAPGRDFDGGELVVTEATPRMQSRVAVVPLELGGAAIFAVNQRPVRGARGDRRVTMRHGVSTVTRGARYTLGVILHDAA